MEAIRRSLRPIPDFPGYYAKRDGTIWSTIWGRSRGNSTDFFEPRQLRPIVAHGIGYTFVWLKQNGVLQKCNIHRLILFTFRGPPQTGQQSRHLDRDRTNSRLSNLRWGTPRENSEDKRRHGTSGRGIPNRGVRGDRHGMAKLTRAQASAILARSAAGEFRRELAKEYRVGYATICGIISRRSWKCLDEPIELNVPRGKYMYRSPNGPRRVRRVRPRQRDSTNCVRGERHHSTPLTAQDVNSIRSRRAAGEPAASLAAEYNVTRVTIYNIIAGRTWSERSE